VPEKGGAEFWKDLSAFFTLKWECEKTVKRMSDILLMVQATFTHNVQKPLYWHWAEPAFG
jgi:hypothetical protein